MDTDLHTNPYLDTVPYANTYFDLYALADTHDHVHLDANCHADQHTCLLPPSARPEGRNANADPHTLWRPAHARRNPDQDGHAQAQSAAHRACPRSRLAPCLASGDELLDAIASPNGVCEQ